MLIADPEADLPDSFFEPGLSDVQAHHASVLARSSKLNNAPLVTAKIREAEVAEREKKKADRWPNVSGWRCSRPSRATSRVDAWRGWTNADERRRYASSSRTGLSWRRCLRRRLRECPQNTERMCPCRLRVCRAGLIAAFNQCTTLCDPRWTPPSSGRSLCSVSDIFHPLSSYAQRADISPPVAAEVRCGDAH